MLWSRLFTAAFCAAMSWAQEPPTWDEQARQKRATKADAAPLDAADKRFFLRALGEHWKQVEAGKLAIKKTTTVQVAQLAQQFIDDHGKSSGKLLSLASRKGWAIPAPFKGDASRGESASTRSSNAPSRRPSSAPEVQTRGASGGLSPDTYASMRGEARMGSLDALSGSKFDVQYLRQVIADHEGFSREASAAAKNCKDDDLRAAALAAVKHAQEHVARAKAVSDSLKPGAASGNNIP